MCVTCGCSDNSEVTVTNPQTGTHEHILADGTVISHSHHDHEHEHPHHPAEIHAQIHGSILQVEQNLLAKNNLLAAQNRGQWVFAELVASCDPTVRFWINAKQLQDANLWQSGWQTLTEMNQPDSTDEIIVN